VCFGVLVAALVHALHPPSMLAWDFTWPWRAARALLARQDPYAVIRSTGAFPFDAPFKYPLPAAIVALPFAPFAGSVAGAAFAGTSAALLCFALLTRARERLTMLVSAPFLCAIGSCQWSPLLVAATLLPGAAGLLAAKPNLGVALFAARPSRAAIFGGVLLVLVSFALVPHWPLEWAAAVRSDSPYYRVPITVGVGPVLLVALLRWRTPEARLLAAMACVPQVLSFYDQLPLLLVARTQRESLWLTMATLAAYIGGAHAVARAGVWNQRAAPYYLQPWALAGCYVPALVVVLRHWYIERRALGGPQM
jgi:hypothetical protein